MDASSSSSLSLSSSIYDGCNGGCGYLAAVVAALAYGSFGVPIKATLATLDNVHPLVFQSYKTITMFVTCWLVMLMGVKPSWTYWGLLSGTLWVLGGAGGVYAIRNAGMAIAIGTWASVMICVNFFWGILIFKEPVANVVGTLGAFVLLGLGLIGMSRFSATQRRDEEDSGSEIIEQQEQHHRIDEATVEIEATSLSTGLLHQKQQCSSPRVEVQRRRGELVEEEDSEEPEEVYCELPATDDASEHERREEEIVVLPGGVEISRRTAGILGAVFNGLMTGSSLIPVHYAKKQGYGGAYYMISYAVGAFIANIVLWNIYFIFMCIRQATMMMSSVVADDEIRTSSTSMSKSDIVDQAWKSMPMWHVRQLLVPGFIAGSLLSLAMFGSILSVTYLGQAVGNSIIQAKILVSGVWAIAWYKEVTGCQTITSWFASASLAVLGILWLSHERLAAKAEGGGNGHDYDHMLLL